MLRLRTLFLVVLIPALFCTTILAAQSGNKNPFSSSADNDPYYPMASLSGLTGLWKVISAESTPAGSFGATGWIDRINRNPGQLTITSAGPSLFVSPHRRVEIGLEIDADTRVLTRRQDQLSLGQATLNSLNYSGGCPGCPLLGPPVAMPGVTMNQLRNTQNNALTGRAGFYPLLPWVNSNGNGFGNVTLSGKINLLSESRGDALGVALRPFVVFPTNYQRADLFANGNQFGKVISGVELLLSKNAGMAALHFNGGVAIMPDVKVGGTTLVSTPNMIPLRVGINIPRTSRLQLVGELVSEVYVGGGTPYTSVDSGSPVDITGGFRGYFTEWLSVGAGYRHTLNQFGGDKNGFVATVSASYIPVAAAPPSMPPTVTCSADPKSVLAGGTVRLIANATTTTGRPLNYAWASPEGKIEGTGPEVRYDTTGLRPGSYNATVRVNDGAEGFADCNVTITVQAPPRPNPPTASCSVDRASVNPGERVNFSVRGTSPDNRPLRYNWSGAVSGTGQSVRLDTTNLAPGTYTASARVTDDRGLTADCNASTTVVAPPPKPVMSKLNECTFKPRIARVDNVCKAILDDVALRLQSDSDAASVVVGYADTKEKPKAKNAPSLAAQRASNVKLYLVTEKGISEGRVQVRAADEPASKVELYLVPRGAGYTGPGMIEKEMPTATPYPHAPKAKMPMKKKAAAKPAAEAAAAPAAAKK